MQASRRSGQVTLAVLIASAITLGMLTLAIILVAQSYRGMEQAKVSAAEATAKQLATSVDDRINAITQPPSAALSILRHDPLNTAGSLALRLERLPVVADILASSTIVSAVYAGYENGDFFLLRKLRNLKGSPIPDVPPGSHYLLQSLERHGSQHIGRWHFYDRNLILLAQRQLDSYDFDPRERVWYQDARETKGLALSRPYVFFTTRETGLTLSQRSMAAPGTILGIDVAVTDLGAQLAELRQTPGSRIAIMNAGGELLASSLPQPSSADAIPGALKPSGQAGIVQYRAEGRSWYGITEPLDAIPDENLSIVLAIPADELLADVWAALTRQTVIAALIAALLLVLGWFMGRRVGKPLELLTDKVSQLSRFRFDTPMRSDSHIKEAAELSIALDDMAHTIHSFQNISTVLNRGQDLNQLLQDILEQIVSIVGQEQGAVYLYKAREQRLELAVSQSMAPPESLQEVNPDISDSELIRQLRQLTSAHPVVAILRNRREKLIGALVIEIEGGDQERLNPDLIVFVEQIAGSAAVAIETRELIESQQALLDGIIRLVANAIDAKSPYTGGHCERVPKLAQMLVQHAEQSTEGTFAGFHMTEDERYEFHLAAWLHDCGKITSPEYVVDKAVKLETIYNRIHEIRTRFEILHRDAEITCLKAILAGEDPEQARQDKADIQTRLQKDFRFLATVNQGSESMQDADIERIQAIAGHTWTRHFSDRLGLSDEELQALKGHPETPLPATETLLADKPGHLRAWGERVPPVRKDDPENRWGFDMTLPCARSPGRAWKLKWTTSLSGILNR